MTENNAKSRKKLLFLCVHNSCRSQIAEALGRRYLSEQYDCYSAGTVATALNPDAVRLMREYYGIDMEQEQYSKTVAEVPEPDCIITMGCEVGCPIVGRVPDEDWGLPDPTGKSDAEFLAVIEAIHKRILSL